MEKINLVEILKDCPTGMELYCTMFEGLEFDGIILYNEYFPIRCRIKRPNGGYTVYNFTKYGCLSDASYAKCVIFPKGKTTWEGFQRPFKDGDVVATSNGDQIFIFKEDAVNRDGSFSGVCYFGFELQDNRLFKERRWQFSRHATEEEKQKLFDAIKANGYKWNAKTKTLEKLIVPKFKIGDIIQDIDTYKVKITEVNIEDECYGYESMIAKGIGSISFSEQDNWKLVPNKFDITTLKPFESRVLIRDSKLEKWYPAIWGLMVDDIDYPYIVVSGQPYKFCIPYEGNEHLIGTTNDCDEYFKTWK